MQSLSTKQMDRRATQIMQEIRAGTVSPQSDAIAELAELTALLADQPVKPKVVARMTITRAVGCKTIVEVSEDATFSTFYRIYSQQGNRRSTKRQVRVGSRNEGLQPYQAHRSIPGLERLADRWLQQPGVESVKIRILSKRAYRRLISVSPDQLGLTRTASLPIYRPVALVRPS